MTNKIRAGQFVGQDNIALRAKQGESLTLEQMRASLPSIFAAEPHSSRSARYVYISTEDMLHALIAKDFLPVEARASRARDEGKRGYVKHMLRLMQKADIEGNTTGRKVGDTSFEVILRNAHDGTGSYQFMAGLLKLLCLNGLVVSDGTVANVKVLHTGNRQRQTDAVIDGAYRVLDQGPKVIETVRNWQSLPLKEEAQVAFAEAAHILRFGEGGSTAIAPKQLLIPRREQDAKPDLWSVFNRVQENAVRGGLTGTGTTADGHQRRSTTREIHGIDQDVTLNKGLWRLAEETAALVAA